jgi:Bacterial PH domain
VRSPQPNREVFRLTPPVVLWWVWLAFAVANVADFVIQGASARFAIVVCAILATITGLVYALALRPRVVAESSGLTIVNPFRDHHVPWAAIQAVDTGEWVRVRYAASAAGAAGPGAAGPSAPAGPSGVSSATSKAVSCWALYLSARAKRKAARAMPASAPGFARPASRPRPRRILTFAAMADSLATAQGPGGAGSSRLPEEAKYLASLPAAKAIAVRLDTRADRERARLSQAAAPRPGAAQPGAAQASSAQTTAAPESIVTARWAWSSMAAVTVPLLALLIILLA